uniref:Uncharacterized protein n=1 Tax=blood disease bacterium R229 TaxID=741978 RepID=G2ZJI9_9RALS|nr:hypothetical protein, Carbohydrate-selective porin OprB domain [blood disease bacterium R229]
MAAFPPRPGTRLEFYRLPLSPSPMPLLFPCQIARPLPRHTERADARRLRYAPAAHNDTVGVAVVVNGLSRAARQYFAAGGLGVLIGDGALNYGTERIAKLYYNWAAMPHLTLGLNYQYVVHPAYNRDRGPVSILGLRVHADF